MSFVRPAEAAKFYNVTQTTLQNWANRGKIKSRVLLSGHRRYEIVKPTTGKKSIIYCRVSSAKQRPDLVRQCVDLRKSYPTHILITDIGSGLNFKRWGFKKILQQLLQGDIGEVVVAHRDRWCRFGFDHFEWLFEQHGAKLTAVYSDSGKSKQDELTEDLMAIVGIFNARYNGARKYSNNKESANQIDEPDEITAISDV